MHKRDNTMARQNFYEQQQRDNVRLQRSPYQMNRMGQPVSMRMDEPVRNEEMEEDLDQEEMNKRDPNAPVFRPQRRVPDQAALQDRANEEAMMRQPMMGAPVAPMMPMAPNAPFALPYANPYVQQSMGSPFVNPYMQPMQPLQGMGQNRLAFANRLLMR